MPPPPPQTHVKKGFSLPAPGGRGGRVNSSVAVLQSVAHPGHDRGPTRSGRRMPQWWLFPHPVAGPAPSWTFPHGWRPGIQADHQGWGHLLDVQSRPRACRRSHPQPRRFRLIGCTPASVSSVSARASIGPSSNLPMPVRRVASPALAGSTRYHPQWMGSVAGHRNPKNRTETRLIHERTESLSAALFPTGFGRLKVRGTLYSQRSAYLAIASGAHLDPFAPERRHTDALPPQTARFRFAPPRSGVRTPARATFGVAASASTSATTPPTRSS